ATRGSRRRLTLRLGYARANIAHHARRATRRMSREGAVSRARCAFDDGTFVAELARRVAFRTESQSAERAGDLAAYLHHELGATFAAMGFECTLLANPVAGGPMLFAQRIEDPGRPTVLSYGHGDVIRGQDAQWRAGLAPWTLVRDGDRLYGRGTADN